MTNEHALRLLQFERVREDAAGYALSEEGREAMLAELPREESGEVSATLELRFYPVVFGLAAASALQAAVLAADLFRNGEGGDV